MIDAIFIQSCSKEIKDGRLVRLIESILKHKTRTIDIYIFLDKESLNVNLSSLFCFSSFIRIIVVDDTTALNPTTKVFHLLINYETEKYKKILLLESNCVLVQGFDDYLNREILVLDEAHWFVCWSTHYGNEQKMTKDSLQDYSSHMNRVAIYNRSSKFLRIINELFLTYNLENISTNYNLVLYESFKNLYSTLCIDSKHILNISYVN